jgi:hypothetical protein
MGASAGATYVTYVGTGIPVSVIGSVGSEQG